MEELVQDVPDKKRMHKEQQKCTQKVQQIEGSGGLREGGGNPTAEQKAKIEGDLAKQWGGQDEYRRKFQGGKIWKFGVNEGRKDHDFGLGMI